MDAGLGDAPTEQNIHYCKEIVERAFQDTDGDFDHPTKQSLLKVIAHLVTFSSAFRKPEVIEKHKAAIGELIQLLP
jgi:hypothetical protein